MKRGDVVRVREKGSLTGKPRPALVLQADVSNHGFEKRVTLAIVSSSAAPAPAYRIAVDPTPDNGLQHRSYVLADQIVTPLAANISEPIGHLDPFTMARVDDALRLRLQL